MKDIYSLLNPRVSKEYLGKQSFIFYPSDLFYKSAGTMKNKEFTLCMALVMMFEKDGEIVDSLEYDLKQVKKFTNGKSFKQKHFDTLLKMGFFFDNGDGTISLNKKHHYLSMEDVYDFKVLDHRSNLDLMRVLLYYVEKSVQKGIITHHLFQPEFGFSYYEILGLVQGLFNEEKIDKDENMRLALYLISVFPREGNDDEIEPWKKGLKKPRVKWLREFVNNNSE